MKLIDDLQKIQAGDRAERDASRKALVADYEELLRRAASPKSGDAERLAEVVRGLGLTPEAVRDDAAAAQELLDYTREANREDEASAACSRLESAAVQTAAAVRSAEAALAAAKQADDAARNSLDAMQGVCRTIASAKQLAQQRSSAIGKRMSAIVAG